MKKFITTKLHAVVSVSVQEQTVEVENGVDEEEEQVEEETAKKFVDGVVDLQSVASPLASSPLLSSSSSHSSVMTLNSPTSKHHRSLKNSISGDGGTSGGNNNSITTGMMTVVEVPPGGSPQLQQQQPQKQKQHAMMGQPISGGGGSTTTTTTIAPTAAQVKMSGYLKKKRNKMGGWRKMYFILQNQLLLSYSSKDDYEKKLAPFKDIINLVPGTVIIPTTGPRFTIETNSKVLYTFRCDDHKSCSEWITALLDSLKGDGSGDKKFSHHALHGTRTSNLQHHLTRRSLSSLSSSSSSTSSTSTSASAAYATDDPSKMAITSIRRLQHTAAAASTNHLQPAAAAAGNHQKQKQTSLSAPNLFYGFGSNGSASGATVASAIATVSSSNVKMGKLVQLPIAGGTARLLERGGGSAGAGGSSGQKMYKILTINEDEDDGENDEKPVPSLFARAGGNGTRRRGDLSSGIKVTTGLPASAAPSRQPTAGESEEKTTAAAAAPLNAGEKPQEPSVAGGKGAATRRGDVLFNSNFRLHTNLGRMQQSIEVCRINSMFGGGKKITSSSSSVAPGKRLNNHVVDSANSNNGDGGNGLAASTGDLRYHSGRTGRDSGGGNNNVIRNNLRGTPGGSATDLRRKPPTDLVTSASVMMEPKPLKDINHNNLAKWSAESITIELTANGYNMTGTGIKSVGSTDTLYRRKPNATTTTAANAPGSESIVPRSRSRSNSHSSNLQPSSSSSSSPPSVSASESQPASSQQKSHGGGSGFSSKTDLFRAGKDHPAPTRRNDRDKVDSPLMVEPIYAVVDLKVKKARRLNQLREPDSLGSVEDGGGTTTEDEHSSIKVDMVRDRETGRLKEKSRSANLLPIGGGGAGYGGSNDYEELNELIAESFVNFGDEPEDSNDGENIYEPINIPEGPLTSSSTSLPSGHPTVSSSQMNNLWRNLKKMNLNHLFKQTSLQDQPNQRPIPAVEDDLATAAAAVAKASTFSEFSKKFGHHRRSIKNKMRGLYERGQSVEAPAKVGGSQSDEKNHQLRINKGEGGGRSHMFSSTFGRNKKSRKSLSFDDFIPRKKHHQQQQQQHLNGVGVICKADKATNEKLHKELKRQLSKRSNSSSGGDSSFNEGGKNGGGIEL